ncbi:MAG: Transcriptional regulator, family protein [Oscillospiraceae bacterium]|nr:Transcriptional regulator, family protein [Oscillospiraceae bacterium]
MHFDEITSSPRVARVSVLGGLTIEWNGAVLTDEINRSLKLWNVLAYLIIHRDQPVPQSEFIEQFWPGEHGANPTNALKTLLYRIRVLLESVFGSDIQPILSLRGSYCWNKAIPCDLDIDHFDLLYAQASKLSSPVQERMTLYEQLIELYRGDFLPKLANQTWVVSISARYHNLFLQAVKDYAVLLEDAQRYEDMAVVCTRAGAFDLLDEDLHILMIRALLRQGKDAAALRHYEDTCDMLYKNLGARPSAELQALYSEIMAVEQELETDLTLIQKDLTETANRPGAFFCEYGFFREAYRLEARRATRSGASVHIALLTVALPDGGTPPLKALNATMDQVQEVLVGNLRRGDVVARYSAAQYVLMLPAANFEDTQSVLDRTIAAFYRQHRRSYLKLTAKIRAVE